MTRAKSDAQLDAEAALPRCAICGKPYLEGYPHRHETPPRPEYDPMPPRPDREAMVAYIRAEYYAELPHRLHVAYVPGRAEPIAVSEYSAGAAGYVPTDASLAVLDTGELGSPSWSPLFHRRVGAVTMILEETIERDEDMAPFPWAHQLQGIRRWCATKHQAWYEHAGHPLCWTLLRHHVLGGYSLGRAAELEGVTEDTAIRLIFDGPHGGDCPKRHPKQCPDGALGKWWAFVSTDLNAIDLRQLPARMLTSDGRRA
jgi:hypothetical protein